MSNSLRIVYDDIVPKVSSITATNGEGTLTVLNLKNNRKAQVFRTTQKTCTITLQWDSPQRISCVAFPNTNLNQDATMRVKMFMDSGGTSLVYDNGPMQKAVHYMPKGEITDFTGFSFGRYTKVCHWTPNAIQNVRRLEIEIDNSTSDVSHMDFTKLVVGDHWSPFLTFERGAVLSTVDASNIVRTIAGDVRSEQRIQYNTLNFNFSFLPEADKIELDKILNYVGTHRHFLLSLMPMYGNKEAADAFWIYGHRKNTGFNYNYHQIYRSQLEMESW